MCEPAIHVLKSVFTRLVRQHAFASVATLRVVFAYPPSPGASVATLRVVFAYPSSPGGVLKFGFGRDVAPQNLKVDPYKYQFFKKKWPIHITIDPIFSQILSKITWFF